MNPRIRQVTSSDNHTLTITFANDEVRVFDMSPYLDYPVFEPLRNAAFFMLAYADHGTVAWPQEIDFDPDTLYLESQPVPYKQAA